MRAGSRTPSRVELGRLGEDFAALFARVNGLHVLARNIRIGQKEIDLLLRDGDCLVFAEVRLRRSDRCGRAGESVTPRKVDRLRAALREEVRRRAWQGPYRLDLMTLDVESGGQRLVLEHYRGI